MTRPHVPNGMDMATWLRLRAERRGRAGVVAGYLHEISDRHRSAVPDGSEAADASGSEQPGRAENST